MPTPFLRLQSGHVGLATVALLCLAAALSLAAAARAVIAHQRIGGEALRHAVAFEAAEAGLDWALARLGSPMAIDTACTAAPALAGSRSFLQTYLHIEPSSRLVTPATGHGAGGAVVALLPACTRTAQVPGAAAPAWDCRCPSDDHAVTPLPASSDRGLRATFSVQFEAASAAGAVQITATGCTQAAGTCAPANGPADAEAQVHAVYALLPALATLPSAALTALGDVRSSAAVRLRNPDAWSGGVAVQAGGDADLAHAVLTGPGGAAPTGLSVSHDTGLSTTTADQLFRRLTALDPATWQHLTAVRTVTCTVGCADALSAAAAQVPGPASLRIAGDLDLVGPVSLGTAGRPLLLVVAGRLTVRGAVHIVGLVTAGDIVWDHADRIVDDGGVQGAVVSAGGYGGTGAPTMAYDLGVLQQLRVTGQAVRVAGGWRDF